MWRPHVFLMGVKKCVSVFQSFLFFLSYVGEIAIAVAARSKAWVWGVSLAGDYGFESRRGQGCLS
jgi:hypothetical protein